MNPPVQQGSEWTTASAQLSDDSGWQLRSPPRSEEEQGVGTWFATPIMLTALVAR